MISTSTLSLPYLPVLAGTPDAGEPPLPPLSQCSPLQLRLRRLRRSALQANNERLVDSTSFGNRAAQRGGQSCSAKKYSSPVCGRPCHGKSSKAMSVAPCRWIDSQPAETAGQPNKGTRSRHAVLLVPAALCLPLPPLSLINRLCSSATRKGHPARRAAGLVAAFTYPSPSGGPTSRAREEIKLWLGTAIPRTSPDRALAARGAGSGESQLGGPLPLAGPSPLHPSSVASLGQMQRPTTFDDLEDAVLELIFAHACALVPLGAAAAARQHLPGSSTRAPLYRHNPSIPQVSRRWAEVYSQVGTWAGRQAGMAVTDKHTSLTGSLFGAAPLRGTSLPNLCLKSPLEPCS